MDGLMYYYGIEECKIDVNRRMRQTSEAQGFKFVGRQRLLEQTQARITKISCVQAMRLSQQ